MGDVVVALPGHPQTVQSSMFDDIIADDITHAYVAGLIEGGIELAPYTSSASVSCGSAIDVTKLWSSTLTISGNAYYAVLPGLPSPPDEGKAAAIVRLSLGSRVVFIMLPVTFPTDIGANSSFLRFDATQKSFEKYVSDGNELVCPDLTTH